MAQRRLGLHRDEVQIAVDGVGCLDGVGDLPDQDCSDLYGIAVGVVDLQVVGFEVAYPHADPAAKRQGQYPPESGAPNRAEIAAEPPP